MCLLSKLTVKVLTIDFGTEETEIVFQLYFYIQIHQDFTFVTVSTTTGII